MPSSVKRRAVWVVDDSRLDAERAAAVLCRDYDVRIFDEGAAAIEEITCGADPDVIVLDWVMAGVSGLDMCRFLRASDRRLQNIGILLLTVQRETRQIVEGLAAGANDYVLKPFREEELCARVGSLARTRALLDRIERAHDAHRKLLELIPDPLLVSDAEGKVVFVNAGAASVLASAPEELLGRSLHSLLPELQTRRTGAASAVNAPELSIRGRVFAPRVVTLGDDAPSTMVSLRDVTEHREREEQRLDLYSMMAHDLRSPLNALTLRLGGMLRRGAREPDASATEDLERIDAGVRSLGSTLNDFLDYASFGSAARVVEEVDLCALIDEAREELSLLLQQRGHHFEGPRIEGDQAPVVMGDRRALQQVLSNLLGNAIKFMTEPGVITAHIRVTSQWVEVAIEDQGAGIPLDLQGKLFRRFARAERKVGGTGLGLLIVKQIIEAHRGAVGLASTEGQGSRFWFRLPRDRQAAAANEALQR